MTIIGISSLKMELSPQIASQPLVVVACALYSIQKQDMIIVSFNLANQCYIAVVNAVTGKK